MRRWRSRIVPAAVAILLPTAIGFFVDVAVPSRVHIARAALSNKSTAVAATARDDSAALRIACSRNRAAGITVMRTLRPLVASCNDRAAPLAVRVRSLACGAVGSRIRIVGARCTRAAIDTASAHRASGSSGGRVVPGGAGDAAVRTVGAAGVAVGTVMRIVVGAHTISDRVGPVDWIQVRSVVVVRRIIVTTAMGDDRADGDTDDEASEIAGGGTGFNFSRGRRVLRDVGYVVDGRAGRDGVDLARHGRSGRPGTLRGRGHEPNA